MAFWSSVTFVDPIFLCFFVPFVVLGFVVLTRVARRSFVLAFLVAASLFFYSSWGLTFLVIFSLSMSCNFSGRQLMLYFEESKQSGLKKAVLIAIVAGNICALGYFKYRAFFATSLVSLLNINASDFGHAIPLGISFYTFQEITLAVDAYRGAYRSTFLEYVLFISFFPHLVAGPLVHHREMIWQFRTIRFQTHNVAIGASLIAIGIFKKDFLADPLAPFVQSVFDHSEDISPGFIATWLAAIGYGLELYFDFSGYSDIALGLARLFGIRLPINFNSPYKADSIVDFWRRWHLTLSRFLREYLYFPLGGNRAGMLRRYGNLMVVMLLGGLWHGANWTFVCWGGLHGLYLVVNHLWIDLRRRLSLPMLPGAGKILTFVSVTVAWVLFRAPNIERAFSMWHTMFFGGSETGAPIAAPAFLTAIVDRQFALAFFAGWLAILSVCCLFLPNSMQIMHITRPFPGPEAWAPKPSHWLRWRPTVAWGALMGALIGISLLITRDLPQQFLYWSF